MHFLGLVLRLELPFLLNKSFPPFFSRTARPMGAVRVRGYPIDTLSSEFEI